MNRQGAGGESSGWPAQLWLGALAATLLLQATAAFLTRLVPPIAPALLPAFGWSDIAIGYLAGVTTLGSIAVLDRHAGSIFAVMQATGIFGRIL
jgi:Mg2+/citrate symporter